MSARSHFDVEVRFRPVLKKFYVLFEVTIFLIIMADRAVAVAEAEKKNLGSLRLQEKFNVVRAYEAIGARQDEFVKDWNKTTGKALNVTLERIVNKDDA